MRRKKGISMNTKIRGVLSAAGALALAVTAFAPASAAPPEKSNVTWATAEIAQVGELEGFTGTSHLIGFSGNTDGFSDVSVVSFNCPEGQLPSWDPDSGCEEVGIVGMYGYAADVSINKKLSQATVDSTVRVYEGETESGEPIWGQARQLNFTMQATGDLVTTKDRQDGYVRTDRERPAVVTSGQVGELDLAGSVGKIEQVKETYKY